MIVTNSGNSGDKDLIHSLINQINAKKSNKDYIQPLAIDYSEPTRKLLAFQDSGYIQV